MVNLEGGDSFLIPWHVQVFGLDFADKAQSNSLRLTR